MLKTIKPKGHVIALFLAIPVIWYVFAVFVPLITAMFYSLFEWKGGPQKSFIGLDNYVSLIKDAVFRESLIHNLIIVVACIIGQVGIAFLLVLMINSRLVKFKGIHRTFGFFPSTISAVCIGFIWMMVFDSRRGVINWFLEAIGQSEATRVWLNEGTIVIFLVSIPLIWQYIGYYMVILLSAIFSIDKEIFEVAELDGASAFQRAIHIVLPLIRNTMLVCITLCIAGNMKVFDHIYIMTKGGPGNASMVMAMYGYNVSFSQMNMGYGSAISVGIFVVSLVVIFGTQQGINFLMKDKGVE